MEKDEELEDIIKVKRVEINECMYVVVNKAMYNRTYANHFIFKHSTA